MNADPKNLNVTPEAEPVSEPTAVPMWLIMAMLVVLFLGAWYYDVRGGWLFNKYAYDPYKDGPEGFQPPPPDGANRKRGQGLFERNCAVCHNNDGAGKPSQAPPLAGSEWVTTKGVNRLIRIPLVGLTGPITVKGLDSSNWNNASMVGLGVGGGGLTDDDVVDILSYIRNAWGNSAPDVTLEQVKKVRDELGNRSQPYTAAELLQLEE
jgi:mono/diheme cytochrome c family protein